MRTGSNLHFLAWGLLAIQVWGLAATIDFPEQRRHAAERFGTKAVAAVQAWEGIMADVREQSVATQLQVVNDFFNAQARWVADQDQYQVADYWATPLELLANAAADCEDYSIAKYLSLLALGVAPESLRLVYVSAALETGAVQAHMVLTWYRSPEAEPLVLDNLNGSLLPAGQRADLTPIFSFSATELWVAGANQSSAYVPRERLSRWRDLLERAAAEGFRPEW